LFFSAGGTRILHGVLFRAASAGALTRPSCPPRLPLSYYQASVPVPTGWDAQPCAYLLFGPPCDEAATEAHGRHWIVQQLPGGICTSWLTRMM
jgi:hypothetical protein